MKHAWPVVVPEISRATSAESVLKDFIDATPPGAVLVAHSNAGLFAPEVARRAHALGVVYVDAALPSKGQDHVSLAAPKFLELLRRLPLEDGLLPKWLDWWQPEETYDLYPSRAAREESWRVQPRLPLGYFTQTVPVPTVWTALPQAYLAFGSTYTEEIEWAVARGWPTRTIDAQHLHLLVDPEAVAEQILSLLAQLLPPVD